MANDIRINITANADQAKQAFASFNSSFTELKSKIDLAKQAGQMFGQTFEQAFKLGKEGAVIQQTEESFSRLVDVLGLAPDLLNKLREASSGTIDDLKLQSATTTLLAGVSGELSKQLGNATPRLLEIAKAANKLNPSLGDTAFLYESIATGVKRASPMILDNLGLTIKIGKANEDYAASLGKTVEELTADEQKQALLNETLRAGAVLIEQAGGAAGSATDSFAQMEVSIKNAEDAMKKKLLPVLSSAATAMTTLMTAQDKINAALVEHEGVMRKQAGGYDEYIKEMTRAAATVGLEIDANGNLAKSYQTISGKKYEIVQANFVLTQSQLESTRAFEANLEQVKNAPPRYDEYTGAVKKAEGATKDLSSAQKALVTDALKPLTAEMLNNKIMATLTGDALLVYAQKTGQLDQKSYETLTALQKLTAEYDKNSDGLIDAKEAAQGYWEALNKLDGKKVNITITTNRQGERWGGESEGFASGGSFIIPPGYPNDSYPLGPNVFAQSGEKVTVTPASGVSLPSVGGSIINVYGWAGDAASLAREIDRQAALERLLA